MCGVFVLAARSTSVTLKITHLPSGETCGSPTRFSFIMSSNVKGCLAWARAGIANARMRTERRIRRMKYLLRQTDECSRSRFWPLAARLESRSWSFSEDGGADAHAGRTFFDGHFEIVRHAHRENVHAYGWKLARGGRVAQFAQTAEVGARAFGIVGKRWHRHQAVKLQGFQARCGQQQRFPLWRVRR